MFQNDMINEEHTKAKALDIHCHCLPGLDDGPRSMTQALDLCRALVREGMETVIATPHLLGYFDGEYSVHRIREGVQQLNCALSDAQINLTVFQGAEVRIDERIPALLETGDILTLCESRYLLLELPHDIFLNPVPLLGPLSERGIQPIIAHPERQKTVTAEPAMVFPWLEKGAHLQITAGSLLGTFGKTAQEAAWNWLAEGQAAFVATDAHGISGTSKIPQMAAAQDAIEKHLGTQVAQTVCMDNPLCVLEDRTVPVTSSFSGGKQGS